MKEGPHLQGQPGDELTLPVVKAAGQPLGDSAEGSHHCPPGEPSADASSVPKGSMVARRP